MSGTVLALDLSRIAITALSVLPLRKSNVVWTTTELGVDAATLLSETMRRNFAVGATSERGIFACWQFIFHDFHGVEFLKMIRG